MVFMNIYMYTNKEGKTIGRLMEEVRKGSKCSGTINRKEGEEETGCKEKKQDKFKVTS